MTDKKLTIALGSDHAGFAYKERIKIHLEDQGHRILDFGTHSEESVDYPLYVRPAAEAVAKGECDRGIVLGGSGNGEAIAANKVRGIRCAVCWSEQTAGLAMEHNNANIISLGQRTIDPDLALRIVDIWLTTQFQGGRHLRRIQEIERQEQGGV